MCDHTCSQGSGNFKCFFEILIFVRKRNLGVLKVQDPNNYVRESVLEFSSVSLSALDIFYGSYNDNSSPLYKVMYLSKVFYSTRSADATTTYIGTEKIAQPRTRDPRVCSGTARLRHYFCISHMPTPCQ